MTSVSEINNSNSFYLRFLCLSKHFSEVCKSASRFSLAEVSEAEGQNKDCRAVSVSVFSTGQDRNRIAWSRTE